MKTMLCMIISTLDFFNLNTIWLNAKALEETADLSHDYSLCPAEEP